jgi:PhnB protein
MAVKPIPDGFNTVIPHMVFDDCTKAIAFIKAVFGAEQRNLAPGPGGKVMHVELKIGDSWLYASDAFGPVSPPHGCVINVWTADPDGTFERALANGATVKFPLINQFWGDRYGQFMDPQGHLWAVSTHVEDVPPDEIAKRSKAWQDENMSKKA